MKTLIKVWIRRADTEYMATSMQIEGWNYTKNNIIDFINGLEESMKKFLDKDIENKAEGVKLEQLIYPEHKDGIEFIYFTMHRTDEKI